MLTRAQKEQLVSELAEKFLRASSVVFTDFTGLKVEEMETLRRNLRETDIEYKVAKKRLIKKALEKSGLQVDTSGFEGQLALALGYADPLVPAQVLYKFSRTNKALKILAGLVEKENLSQEAILELAMLPSKEVLFARLVGSIRAPISRFINVLGGNLRGLVNVFKAIKMNNE